ncbi:penicillin-binding protein 1A [Desulfosalsimonas propionicica]|uniref:peptidoglycan glycosyltransferase n=1 Tax=Desulfosalsimonas propionicica TaxID=332175 RepID=A0A7W0CB88_9BACT|nr:penicillin-binding protein 1A [Desulfosalsimonas propionicica]MBA2882489.1 penicillin-binding protein 1A [Desulfosalsimonas propionicica]
MKTIVQSVWMKIVLVAAAAAVCGATVAAVVAARSDLPEIRGLEDFSPSAVSRIYSADQVLLAEVYVRKRSPVPLEQVPDALETALLTTEDRQFRDHSGLDIKGILRALVHDIKTGSLTQGASTITQQLAKTLFLTPEKSLERKLKEAFLALQLERRYTKDEILELYLNQIYYGSGAYGVEMAARTYFAKPASELNLAECAMIAGLPKAPSTYSPLVNPDLAIQRRNLVLAMMHHTGNISKQAFQKAADTPYQPPGEKTAASQRASYFVDYVKQQLRDTIGADLLYKGGITVQTTLSHELQQAADQAVAEGLSSLSSRIAEKKEERDQVQGALVAIDVQTGAIRAMTGGRDYQKTQFNRAVAARRQPGSAFKPIIYACALENGYDQDSLLLDAPMAFSAPKGRRDWQPENFSGDYAGEITLRKAVTASKNIPAVRVLQDIGPAAAIDFARKMGIESRLSPYLSMALGSFELNLLELTSAYTVFPNQGRFVEPGGIARIIGPDNRIIWESEPRKHLAMSRTSAAIMTDVLKGVIREGSGRGARDLGRELAGKTGTTNQYRDALFVGFSPGLAAGVWVGRDDYAPLGPYETGARAALPIWKQFMEKAIKTQPLQYFDFPDALEQVRMDPVTGKRVSGNRGVSARIRKNPDGGR